jgi:hypothetical protein
MLTKRGRASCGDKAFGPDQRSNDEIGNGDRDEKLPLTSVPPGRDDVNGGLETGMSLAIESKVLTYSPK